MPEPLSETHAAAAVPEYLTVEQVAELLQVSTKTVRRWVKDDASMPAWQKDQVIRFPRSRLLNWLRLGEQGAVRPRRRQVAKQTLSEAGEPPSRRKVKHLAAVAGGSEGLCATACAIDGPEVVGKGR